MFFNYGIIILMFADFVTFIKSLPLMPPKLNTKHHQFAQNPKPEKQLTNK